MATKTKTFKIGEYAMGGIIRAEIKGFAGDIIQVKVIDWDSKEVLKTKTISVDDDNVERELDNFLNNVTTSYYTDNVMKWIKDNTKMKMMWH